MLVNNPYGGGNAPISHMYTFMSFGTHISEGVPHKKYKENWDQQWESFHSCLEQNDKEGKATQITLTDGQFASDPIYKHIFNESGFVEVFRHTNPNTSRVIHTFMRPPVIDPSIMLEVTYSLNRKNEALVHSEEFWENMYARKGSPYDDYRAFHNGFDDIVAYHGGSCCGWGSVWGVKTNNFNKDFKLKMATVLGAIQLVSRKMAWQFAVPDFFLDIEKGAFNYNNFNGWIRDLAGFSRIFNFKDMAGIPWAVFAKSDNRILV